MLPNRTDGAKNGGSLLGSMDIYVHMIRQKLLICLCLLLDLYIDCDRMLLCIFAYKTYEVLRQTQNAGFSVNFRVNIAH